MTKKINIITIFYYLYCIFLIVEFFYWFQKSIYPEQIIHSFEHFSMSDWLINYKAGFVRRGLWGEFLLYLYNTWRITPKYLIFFLSYTFLFLFLYLFIKEWKKNNLSLFLLPSVCLIGAFSMSSLIDFRRDILIFLLIWQIFKAYNSFLEGKSIKLIYLYTFSIIAILSHEASFFYFFPLLGLHYFLNKRTILLNKKLIKTVLFLLPILLTMLFCVFYKGNDEIATQIWNSWNNYFISEFGRTIPVGKGCEALGWNGIETFKMHFKINYLEKSFGIHRFAIWPFIFMSVYYLLIQVNKIQIGTKYLKNENKFSVLEISHILILQFIFLLPMFTILSCDFRRVILYWTLSSFLFYFSLKEKSQFTSNFSKYSQYISNLNKILSNNFLGNKYVYVFIFFALMIPFDSFREREALLSTVPGNLYLIFKSIIEFCN